MPAMKDTQKSAKSTTTDDKPTKRFTAEERAAMKERAKELKAEANKAEAEEAVIAKIAEMSEPDRTMAERLHAVIKASAPALSPKLWYGMPAYAKDGKVLCFFQPAQKFNSRYATFGFNDDCSSPSMCTADRMTGWYKDCVRRRRSSGAGQCACTTSTPDLLACLRLKFSSGAARSGVLARRTRYEAA